MHEEDGSGADRTSPAPSRMIWDRSAHNAFTDLTRYNNEWYCTFREASEHMRGVGRIRLIKSVDGKRWSSVKLFRSDGVDLRDPKLSCTPDGRLMLLAGGSRFDGERYLGRQPRVSLSSNGTEWTRLKPILQDGDWLWRISWHRGRAYGITYRIKTPKKWTVTLLSSDDGLSYEEVCELDVNGKPNEATVRFHSDGRAVALVRREGGDKKGWVGTSTPPYTDWSWNALKHRLGGPNLLVLPSGQMWAATRLIAGDTARTCIGRLTQEGFTPSIELPSGGDCSYPGMAWYRQRLWVSYYSSHEGKTSIYFTKLRLP